MRGKRAKIRKIENDPVYGSKVVEKFINYVMLDGKKTIARKQVYDAMEKAAVETKLKPLEIFEKALATVKPKLEVKSRRVGGSNYQVPMPVSPERQDALAMRWIITAARAGRKHGEFSDQLSKEFVDAFNKQGSAYKKKEETHKMAEANKAFSHFNW